MKFKMLLWYMARRMEILTRTHPEFIARLHERDFVIQISSDEGTHRFFHVHHNRVLSRQNLYASPDITLRFNDDDTAFRLLALGGSKEFMVAMQAGDVKVTGDYTLLMWFMSVSQYLRPDMQKLRDLRGSSPVHNHG